MIRRRMNKYFWNIHFTWLTFFHCDLHFSTIAHRAASCQNIRCVLPHSSVFNYMKQCTIVKHHFLWQNARCDVYMEDKRCSGVWTQKYFPMSNEVPANTFALRSFKCQFKNSLDTDKFSFGKDYPNCKHIENLQNHVKIHPPHSPHQPKQYICAAPSSLPGGKPCTSWLCSLRALRTTWFPFSWVWLSDRSACPQIQVRNDIASLSLLRITTSCWSVQYPAVYLISPSILALISIYYCICSFHKPIRERTYSSPFLFPPPVLSTRTVKGAHNTVS